MGRERTTMKSEKKPAGRLYTVSSPKGLGYPRGWKDVSTYDKQKAKEVLEARIRVHQKRMNKLKGKC